MNTFKYRILTRGSAVVEGKKTVANKAELIAFLKKSGYIVLNVQEVAKSRKSNFFSDRAIKKSTVFFTQELGVLLDSGIPLDRSMKILSDAQENRNFRDMILEILGGLKSGQSLAESLNTFPNIFSTVYVNMVLAGEESGVLPKVLKRLGTFMERAQKIRSEITSSLMYPVFLIFAGVLSVAALMLLVIPKFSTIFAEVGIALPLSTQLLINMSDIGIKFGWLIILFFIGLYFLYQRLRKKRSIQEAIDKKKLKIPILGGIFWRSDISRFSRTLGTLLENGVPLLKSIDIAEAVLSNSYLGSIIEHIKPDIKAGKGLIVPLGPKSFFPGIAYHLLTVGEETGTLDEMLIRVSDTLDNDVEQRIKRLISLAEPALILFMGCAIGAIVISMLSAIFSINEVSF
ncbi:MAG: type II secretion system F family protein [Candidatus Scalindua sp.]|nr:type II secretion system F family protein [Candidatus Scalindua sp.]